jgi:hypothetical protein
MRIGFSSIYSWRPHVEHMYFLATLARRAGHETYFLTCDSDLPTCYGRELRPERSALAHCVRCRIGGVRSYEMRNVSAMGMFGADSHTTSVDAYKWALSSASTLGRFESDADLASADFRNLVARLEPAARTAFIAAKGWIETERLDAICLFNGRMDATRGVLEAARAAGVRCITFERTWFGDGLHLTPDENCLGLGEISRLVGEWKHKPLTRLQAFRAAKHVALRYLRRNNKEWRAYNTKAKVVPWPVVGARRRVLLTPGSRNEIWSHPDWVAAWPETTAALDAIMTRLKLQPQDVVLRCHPNWGERIGSKLGELSERYYTDWAKARGILAIASRDTVSTLGLIEHADAIVVGGGSAALEAAIIGKQVIAISPSVYQSAGFESSVYSPDQLDSLILHVEENEQGRALIATQVSRLALRFCYTMAYRAAQYVDYVRSESTTAYGYLQGADPQRLIDLIHTGSLSPDDATSDVNEFAEDEVLAIIGSRDWERLANDIDPAPPGLKQSIRRRLMYRAVDRVRSVLPHGDR